MNSQDSRGIELWRANEVARRTGLSRSFVYQLMDRGELAFVQIGRARRIRPADVEALISRNLHGTAA